MYDGEAKENFVDGAKADPLEDEREIPVLKEETSKAEVKPLTAGIQHR